MRGLFLTASKMCLVALILGDEVRGSQIDDDEEKVLEAAIKVIQSEFFSRELIELAKLMHLHVSTVTHH